MRPFISLFLTFFCLTIFSLSAQTIYYVDVNSTDPEDGSSWNNPYHTLQIAIDKASDGDQIWVATGKYNPTTLNRNGAASSGANLTFFINKDLTIFGGFKRGDDFNDRDPGSKPTVLEGKNTSFNHYQIVNINSCNAIIDGFTIANGLANGASAELQQGAGINIFSDGKNVAPQIRQCIIQDNTSDGNGSGVYVSSVNSGVIDFSFTDCIFTNNKSSEEGGAVYVTADDNLHTPVFSECQFINNSATGDGGAVHITDDGGTIDFSFINCSFTSNNSMDNGGAIYANNTFLKKNLLLLDNCTFTNNVAGISGGGAYLALTYSGSESPIFRIRSTDFSNNQATPAGSAYGGALFLRTNVGGSSLEPLIEQCNFTGNSSMNNGGAVRLFSSSGGAMNPTFSRCRFDANTTDASGGALSVRASTQPCNPIFVNCIFFDNFGDASAGAISIGSVNSGTVDADFYYCDFVSNNADLFGAVFRIVAASNGGALDVAVINSIFYNNTNGSTPRDINISPESTATIEQTLTDRTNCTNTGATTCNSIGFNADPLFFNTATGDLRIPDNSPAHKSAIDLSSMGALFKVDYAGMPRPESDPDIGAYQYDENALAVEWVAVNTTQKAADVIINWETVNEREVAFYQIEHSRNGRDFQKIGSVAAHNKASLNFYDFKHQPTATDKHFYRIIQVANDGTTDNSKVVAVDFIKESSIQVYPNPVRNTLHFVGDLGVNSIIQFVDYQGVVKKEINYAARPISVRDLPSGLYLLRTKNGNWQQRIIIEN